MYMGYQYHKLKSITNQNGLKKVSQIGHVLTVGSTFKLTGQFDNGEVLILTMLANKKLLQMKEATLDLLILNNFEKHQENDFFQSFEALDGRSMCDISLESLDAIHKAIGNYSKQYATDSLAAKITEGDLVRTGIFKETQTSLEGMIIQGDLNLKSTLVLCVEKERYKVLDELIQLIFDQKEN